MFDDGIASAEGVYLAELESIQPAGWIKHDLPYEHTALFRVTRVLKGPERGVIVVPASVGPEASCGLEDVRIGQTWILPHRGPESRFPYAHWCSSLIYADSEVIQAGIDRLGPGQEVSASNREEQGAYPGGSQQGNRSLNYGRLALPAAVFLAFLGAILIINRRRSTRTVSG